MDRESGLTEWKSESDISRWGRYRTIREIKKRKTGRYKKRKGETEQGKEKREDERTLRGEDRVD